MQVESSNVFVWNRIQAEAGAPLDRILARKEAERLAGTSEFAGVFWWGIGTNLCTSVCAAAQERGEELPARFSKMLSRPKKHDEKPTRVRRWTRWQDPQGCQHDFPAHVVVTSRENARDFHFALVCRSFTSVALHDDPFDDRLCRNHPSGQNVGAQQVTSLLSSNSSADHSAGRYRQGFRATVVCPWLVRLVAFVLLTPDEREQINA